MPLQQAERAHVETILRRFCDERSSPHGRGGFQLEPRFEKNSAFIVERRPSIFHSGEWTEHLVAKFRYRVAQGTWELYCPDRNGRWHLFSAVRPNRHIEPLLAEVERDTTGIFWG
jgi:hypothetical protein